MSAKRSGLGRGLDALLPKVEKAKGVEQLSLTLLEVSPYQPRKRIDPAAIAELAQSIAQKGVLQPLLVRPIGERYQIVAGERRFRAAQQAGLSSVPAVVRDFSDQETLEIAIIENVQREDLSAVEEARAFRQLMDFGMNQEEVAKAVGKSRSAVANTLRLLNLDDEILDALDEGLISAGHARAILAQPAEDRRWALQQITTRQLSVRDAERLTRDSRQQPPGAPKPSRRLYDQLEGDLARHVGTKVRISGKEKGKLELHFHSPDELQRLLDILGYQG